MGNEFEQPTFLPDGWDSYAFQTEDGIVVNFLDLSIDPSGTDRFPIRLLITIKIRTPNEAGLPKREEDQQLWTLEDHLAKYVSKELNGRYVGRSTHGGQRIFCYYLPSNSRIDDAVIAAAIDTTYSLACSQSQDPDWTLYAEFLYPSDEQMQLIRNRRIREILLEHGDHLDTAREVDHWLIFPTLDDCEKCVQTVGTMGFDVRERGRLDDGRYGIQICRADPVESSHIDQLVIELVQLACECNGKYDGWETTIHGDE